MSTLVIHLDDRSTDFLSPIYDGMGYEVISKPLPRATMVRAIGEHDRVYMLGHGSGMGLLGFNLDWRDFAEELASKQPGIYVWCHADDFARPAKLSGLVSGMFISEVGEASMNGIHATQTEIDASNNLFAATVRAMLDKGEPPEVVQERYSHATCLVTKFNQNRMYIFKDGASTPVKYVDPDRERWVAREQDFYLDAWRRRYGNPNRRKPGPALGPNSKPGEPHENEHDDEFAGDVDAWEKALSQYREECVERRQSRQGCGNLDEAARTVEARKLAEEGLA